MDSKKQKVIAIVGPTATGKSDLAVRLAKEMATRSRHTETPLHLEVISADSRQVYKGFDIGSGKITTAEMKGVPHHMLDVVSPRSVFSVAQYQKKARTILHGVLKRGNIPVIVGGTGFYIDALLFEQQFPNVPPNPALRQKLEALSTEELVQMLAKLDAERLNDLQQNNRPRLIRAIEIAQVLGKVPKLQMDSPYDVLWIGLDLPDAELEKKITARLTKRLRQGMIDEVTALHKKGVSWKRLESLGLEYRYCAQFLQNKISRKELEEKIILESRKYAKRQRTWFRRNKKIQWFQPVSSDIKKIKAKVCAFLN